MGQPPKHLKETPSQTAGPYVHIGCTPNFCGIPGVFSQDLGAAMVNDRTNGTRIVIVGCVRDGTGTVLRDAMVEIWQADAEGHYPPSPDMPETSGDADPHFTGWGRCPTDMDTGAFRFDTIRPGPVPHSAGGLMAPHVSVWIVARGINLGLHTRMYFPDEAKANAADPVLSRIEDADRAATLLARSEGAGVYRFDINLQGDAETVFLNI